MTTPIATFSYQEFIAVYPTFSCLSALQAQAYFDQATMYHRNDGFGPVATEAIQKMLLYMLTAHIATLLSGGSNGGAAPVGRLSSASEGSVSAEFDLGADVKMNQAWFVQTQYGLSYWQATAAYRQMRYVPPIQRNFNPWPGAGGRGGIII